MRSRQAVAAMRLVVLVVLVDVVEEASLSPLLVSNYNGQELRND